MPILLFVIASALSAVSAAVLFSADATAHTYLGPPFAIGAVSGLIAGLVVWRFTPIRWFRDMRYLLLMVAVALAVALLVFGTGPRGTDTKIRLYGIEPVEVIKVLVVLFLASFFASRDLELRRLESRRVMGLSLPRWRDVAPVAVGVAAALALFFLQRDLGPALVLYLTFLSLFIAASGRVVIGLTGLASLIGAFWLTHYFRLLQTVSTRVEMWLSPWDTHRSGGGQLAEGLWALASGGLRGEGLQHIDLRFIPAGHTDLILAATGEALGVWGVIGMLALFAVLFALMTHIAWSASTAYERYVAYGFTMLLAVETVMIAAGTLGVLPLTGIPVPFMSYGKAAMLTHFVMLGIVAGVGRQRAEVKREPLSRWAAVPVAAVMIGLGIVGARAWHVMAIDADAILVRGALTPQADGVRRFTYNRRLLELLRDLPRGRVLDRRGVVLASDDAAGRRVYPLGENAPHIIGHSRTVWADPRTVERAKADDLRGFSAPERVQLIDGQRVVQRDYTALVPAFRERFLAGGIWQALQARNRDVSLTLDADMQRWAMAALRDNLPKINGVARTRAAGVALDPWTGAILAAVSLPTYDPNAIDRAALDQMFGETTKAALDRARTELYAPGSAFKLVTAVAALGNGIPPSRTVACAHAADVQWTCDRREYHRRVVDDEAESAHGEVVFGRALAESCNVFFATVGVGLGPEALWRTAHEAFGLTLKDAPTAAALAPRLADSSYGQGLVTATPLEMATVVAAIENGGLRISPTLYRADVKPLSGATRVIPEANAALVGQWMEDAVRAGTGRRAAIDGWVVRGKTGTAETESGDGASHSWFVGAAHRVGESRQQSIAFAFLIENGGYGGKAAAQAAHDFLASLGRSSEVVK